jgi:hypothetical protein
MKDNDDDNVRELNILDIEHFLELHKKEIMDFIMDKLFKDSPRKIKITGEIFDRLVNQVTRDVPFGSMIQFALASAVMYSYWCGYQSERMKREKVSNFKDEYIEQIQDAIIKAFAIGRSYGSERAT